MKYVIEIEDTPFTEVTSETVLYKAKNFNSLVFDKNGLDKLEKFDSNEEYNNGYNNALEDVTYAMDVLKSMTGTECAEWFEDCVGVDEVVCGFTVQRIVEITKAYEEKKKAEEDTIKVGDVIHSEMSNVKALVIYISEWGNYHCLHSDGTMFTLNVKEAKYWTKVGHFDEVSQVLDKLRGEYND